MARASDSVVVWYKEVAKVLLVAAVSAALTSAALMAAIDTRTSTLEAGQALHTAALSNTQSRAEALQQFNQLYASIEKGNANLILIERNLHSLDLRLTRIEARATTPASQVKYEAR